MVNHEGLNRSADIIESVLKRHRVAGNISGGDVTPNEVKFHVAASVGTKVSSVSALAEKIATALGAKEARISRQGACIAITVARSYPEPNWPKRKRASPISDRPPLPEDMSNGDCIKALLYFDAHPEASIFRTADRLGITVDDANRAWEHSQKQHQFTEG